MDTEAQEKCVGTGMAIIRDNLSFKEATPVLFRSNLLLKKDAFKVPHSELAMHTKAAGKEIVALFATRNMAFISFANEKGECEYTFGTINEVLSTELVDTLMERYFPKPVIEARLGPARKL